MPFSVPDSVPQSVHTKLERVGCGFLVKGAWLHRAGKMLGVWGCRGIGGEGGCGWSRGHLGGCGRGPFAGWYTKAIGVGWAGVWGCAGRCLSVGGPSGGGPWRDTGGFAVCWFWRSASGLGLDVRFVWVSLWTLPPCAQRLVRPVAQSHGPRTTRSLGSCASSARPGVSCAALPADARNAPPGPFERPCTLFRCRGAS
ncbi:MAG: hypothetical protein RL216_2153 [Pseudomonadota bacterium]